MLGYSGGLDGLASSRNLKCIWYLAFNLPNSHLIAGKRMQLLDHSYGITAVLMSNRFMLLGAKQ